MFNCRDCIDFFDESKVYVNHVKYCHRLLRYKCGALACSRQFSGFESFRKHVRVKHSKEVINNHRDSPTQSNVDPQRDSQFTNDDTFCLDDDTLDNSNIVIDSLCNDIEDIQNIYPSETSDYSDIEQNENIFPSENNISTDNFVDYDINSCEQPHQLADHIYFAAKMHSYFDVSRSRVQLRINDTNILSNRVLSGIEQGVLKVIAPHDGKKIIRDEIPAIFKQKKIPVFRNSDTIALLRSIKIDQCIYTTVAIFIRRTSRVSS